MDYYQTLGVDRNASAEQIKAAYRRLARKYHPDVSGESDAHDKIKDINEAYSVLGYEEKKLAYDRGGAQSEHFFDGGFPGGLHDLFDTLFSRAGRAQRVYGLALTLEQAFSGGKQHISLNGQSIEVDIPPGVRNGDRIQVPPGIDGLELEVHYQPHAKFAVEGGNVLGVVHIPVWKIALGGAHTIETLGGVVEAQLPVGLKPGQRIHLAGRGMPATSKKHAGGHWAQIEVEVPTPKNSAQKKAYEALRESFDKKKTKAT